MSKVQSLSNAAVKKLRELQFFMFDCDGVLWHNNTLIEGAVDLISYLKKAGKNIFLITNNSTKSRKQYVEKCNKLGLDVTESEIICTAYVAASYLRQIKFDGKLYALGMDGIHKELESADIQHVMAGDGDEEPDGPASPETMSKVTLRPDITDVLVGFDGEFNYRKMTYCASYICRGGRFFATNTDAFFPVKGSKDVILPGTGAIVHSIEVATRRQPIVIGKPFQPMMEVLRADHHVDPSRAVMVGDRLDTDILFGNRFGATTVVVITGVTEEADLSKPLDEELAPNYRMESVRNLYDAFVKLDDARK